VNAPEHVLGTAVALDEARLLYVPVPKTGCTAVLWALAGAAGLSEEDFARSRKLEVTRALTVHDLSVWGPKHTLAERSERELERILHSSDWLRVSVVREPLRRLWSAWASKLLVRDPRFVPRFGGDEWFPAPPASADDVLRSFRQFVRALAGRPPEWHDPHWAPQAGLLAPGEIPYGHVGRLERLDESVSLLAARLREHGLSLPPLRPANASLLPYDAGVLDAEAHEAALRFTTQDREAFGYAAPAPAADGPREQWRAAVEASLPAVRAVIDRHERIADLRRLARDAERAFV